MKRIKRWTTSIVSSFDSVLNQVENHESVIASSIHELQTATAKARAKLNLLNAEITRMREQCDDHSLKSAQWQERAIRLKGTEKGKAIECLRRRNQIDSERMKLEQEIPKHEQLARQLETDVSKMESQVKELGIKKRAFSARSSRSKAMELCENIEHTTHDDIADAFERWEVKLAQSEINFSSHPDSLDNELSQEEELADLDRELDELESPPEK